MKHTILAVATIFLVGCGGGTTKTYQTETIVENNVSEPVPVPEGDAIIVEGGGDVIVTDDSVTIECGEGGCGDVYVGNEIDNSDNSDNSNEDVNNTDVDTDSHDKSRK